MNLYNKIMLNLWLIIGVVMLIFITYKGFTEGFQNWGFYYIFAGIAFLMYFARKFMMKRMAKHTQYLEEKGKEK